MRVSLWRKANVSPLIFVAADAAHNSPSHFITGNEGSPVRRLMALALLFGIVVSTVPAGAYDICPKHEGYPDCSNRR
jgi:hypothetical protein